MRTRITSNGNIIGLNLRRIRLSKGMEQKEMAERLQLLGIDVPYNFITIIESNRRTVNDVELFYIAHILDVDISEFFTGISIEDVESIRTRVRGLKDKR